MTRARARAAVLAFSLLALPLRVPAAPAAPDTAWIDEARLEAGQAQLKLGPGGRFRGHIEAAILIEARPKDIWAVLDDCEKTPEYVPHVVSCKLIETLDGGRAQLFRQEVKLSWFLPKFEHVFRLDYEPYVRMQVHRVSGPLERLDGSWWLVPRDSEHTLLLYSLDFEPGLPVPRFVVAATLKHDLPRTLNAIRARAEAAN
jgi:ribosome-associated toxin RatA of RatAB toxin-antitoxin module